MINDDHIQQSVLHHLKTVMRLNGEVTVRVTAGAVALGGWLPSPAKRWAVVESVRRIAGVARVHDGIQLPPFSTRIGRAGDQAKDLVTSVVGRQPWASAKGTRAP
jgi:hypothetical protein